MNEEKKTSIEEKLAELEEITRSMESGELTLEESLKAFERGVALIRESNEYLGEAEKKIRILTEGTENP